MTAKVMSDS